MMTQVNYSVASHEDLMAMAKEHQGKVTVLLQHYEATMQAINNDENFDAETFPVGFNVETFLNATVEGLQVIKDDEERTKATFCMFQAWTLVSLCTRLPIPSSFIVMDEVVAEAYRNLIRSTTALAKTVDEINKSEDGGEALLKQAHANLEAKAATH